MKALVISGVILSWGFWVAALVTLPVSPVGACIMCAMSFAVDNDVDELVMGDD